MREVEASSKLKITALVGNTHLIEETTVENLVEGAKFTGEVSAETGLRVGFIGVMEQFLEQLGKFKIPYPILPMKRLLLPPWLSSKKPKGLSATHSRDRFGQLQK